MLLIDSRRMLAPIISVAGLLVSAQLSASNPIHPDRVDSLLGIEQLQEQVLSQNAGLDALRAAVLAANAQVLPAGSLDDPQFSAGIAPHTIGGLERDGREDRRANLRIEISQAIPWPGTLELRRSVAQHEGDAAIQNVAALRLRLVALTAADYAEWVYVHQALVINSRNQTLVNELRAVAENRYAAGLASQQDVLQAEVELQHLKHRDIELRRLQRVVRTRINALLNRAPETSLAPPSALPAPEPIATDQVLRRAALAHQPELAQWRDRINAQQDREALAAKAFYPDFKVFGGYNSLWDQYDKRWVVGASINLPIARNKRRAVLDSARATSEQLDYQLQDARAILLSALDQARAAAEEASHEIALYESELIPRTRENLSAARSAYSAGGGAFLEVIVAEQLQLKAELELERARADRFAAVAQLTRWVGGVLPAISTEASHTGAK